MSLIGKFASVGSATMASRILGFAREALIAAAIGVGPVTDAFYAAFRFPNLFRRLFAEGAFNTAFIPLFAKQMEGGGVEAARRFGEDVLAVLMTVLLALSPPPCSQCRFWSRPSSHRALPLRRRSST